MRLHLTNKIDTKIDNYAIVASFNSESANKQIHIIPGSRLLISCLQSKKDSKDHESIQSSTTPVPEYQMGK